MREYTELERAKIGIREGYVSTIGNFILFIVKLIFGLISHSYALIVDSVHSLSDIITSVVVIIGFKISAKPADKEHPFGHQRAESIATLIVAVLLIVIGVEFARAGIYKIINPNVVKSNILLLIIIILTIIFKEAMARYSFHLEGIIGSDTLKADAWHHRSDSISSVLVLISMIASYYKIYWIDGVMGVFISAFIIFIGVKILMKAFSDLIGKAPARETVQKIRGIVNEFDNIKGVHDIVLNSYGNFTVGSAHVVMPESMSLKAAHEIVDRIENKIKEELNINISIHIDPVDENDELYRKIKAFLDSVSENNDEIEELHDIHIVKHRGIIKVYFEVRYKDEKSSIANSNNLKDEIIKRFNDIDEVEIEKEPEYTY